MQKNRKLFYLTMLIVSFTATSCVSYETSISHSKNKNASRWTYNTGSKTSIFNNKKENYKNSGLSNPSYTGVKSADAKKVLNEAGKFKGSPYKLGGTTSSGIDCSGLVYVSFQKINKSLPRRSTDMSNEGIPISLSSVKEGDLLFFATSGGSNINHVGIVYEVSRSGGVSFIHASTSKGVMVSSMEENYWKGKFIKARRIL